MWPIRLEMTRDECKKCLRYLELDAYGSMVSVLRAQGPFTNEKQMLLQELAKVLHISNERHRAEIRRAVNDEKLTTIAEQFNGPNTSIDWTIEGRRTIPLIPRLKARSAFTTLANSFSLATAIANEKNPDRRISLEKSEKVTNFLNKNHATEMESPSQMKIDQELSVDIKIPNVENDLDNNTALQENSDFIEDEKVINKDVIDNVIEKSKVLNNFGKRKSPSPVSTPPPNKVLVVSPSTLEVLNHNIIDESTFENNVQVPHAITHHQNVTLIPLTVNEISDSKESAAVLENSGSRILVPANKHISTIPVCTSNTSKSKTIIGTVQNKIATKVTPVSSGINMSVNKIQLENNDTQSQDNINNTQKTQRSENTSSNSCIKRITSFIHTNTKPAISKAIIPSNTHRIVAVHPGTTVSSGPGPPHVNKTSTTCKKLPSEQTTTFNHQSTAKMVKLNTGITINPKKTVNIHHSNAKLTSKTNVIVIQKGNAKGVTLSHAGKEVLGKVIMGGKNLRVTSQHNASSVSVLPQHLSLNNGEQTTALQAANSPNSESVKANIKSGNAIMLNLRQNVLEKNKILSQLFDSSSVINSESKTMIQATNVRLLKEEDDVDEDLKTDSIIISTTEEKLQKENSDVKNLNLQMVNQSDSRSLESKEILVKPKQLASIRDDTVSNIKMEYSAEHIDLFDETLESVNTDPESFQCPVDNDDIHVSEKPKSLIVSINQTNDHVDS